MGRERNERITLRVSEQEMLTIRDKMNEIGMTSMNAYLRKMATDGIIVTVDFPELKEVARLVRYAGNNLNQLAKKANSGESIYPEDVQDIRERFDAIYDELNDLNKKLARLI